MDLEYGGEQTTSFPTSDHDDDENLTTTTLSDVDVDEMQKLINITDGSSLRAQTEATNTFLNRKLNHYSKLRQVGYLKPHDLALIPPTRTFSLLELVREVAKVDICTYSKDICMQK